MKEKMKFIPNLYKKGEECCGCTACYAICPKQAISMIEDEKDLNILVLMKINACVVINVLKSVH